MTLSNTKLLELKNISKAYRQGDTHIPILNDFSFSAQAGESVAIVGQSGSGKSTLLSLMAGLDQPDAGEIFFNGRSLKSFTDRDWSEFRRRSLSIVFQQFHLFSHLTALENVLLPLELLEVSDPKAQALELLKKVGLDQRKDHLPGQLSGGECQRVAIARALAPKPKVILADEPSGSLDQATGDVVMDLVFRLVQEFQTTLILVTHNMDLARRCGRQVTLQGSKQ
jgi:putative ABC transport system ATP-binding protein